MGRWMFLLVAALAAVPAGAELYKWTDAEGNVHYTDTPPPTSAKKSERKKLADRPSAPAVPYALQQAMKNAPVTLYTYDCGDGCTKAAALLARRGIPFTPKDPLDPATREEMKKATGGDEVAPVLMVGRRVLKGYEEGAWNSALTAAGYPTSAVGPVPPVPAARPAPAKPAPEAAPEAAAQPPASN
ncbi:MAG TPA: glutaredoxin family protein [Burkholderiales bacterium]|jgi:hypothetical protein|nr:glutaredoxin family protein [Burkholderiales bacterium]